MGLRGKGDRTERAGRGRELGSGTGSGARASSRKPPRGGAQGSNQDASTSKTREECNNPVEGLDWWKEKSNPRCPKRKRRHRSPPSQRIWKGGKQTPRDEYRPRGKKVPMKRTRQTRQPVEGPVIQGPFHPYRTGTPGRPGHSVPHTDVRELERRKASGKTPEHPETGTVSHLTFMCPAARCKPPTTCCPTRGGCTAPGGGG